MRGTVSGRISNSLPIRYSAISLVSLSISLTVRSMMITFRIEPAFSSVSVRAPVDSRMPKNSSVNFLRSSMVMESMRARITLSLRTPLPESRCARTKEPPMTSQDSPLCWNMPS